MKPLRVTIKNLNLLKFREEQLQKFYKEFGITEMSGDIELDCDKVPKEILEDLLGTMFAIHNTKAERDQVSEIVKPLMDALKGVLELADSLKEKLTDTKCSVCGEIAGCMPYGKDRADICYECAHKPEHMKTTNEYMEEHILTQKLKPDADQKN